MANLRKLSSLLEFMFDVLQRLPEDEVTAESLDTLLYKLELNKLQIITWFGLSREERILML